MFTNLEIITLDHPFTKSHLVVCDGGYFEANSLTVQLIESLKSADTVDEGIHGFLATHPGYDYVQTKKFIDDCLLPKLKGNRQTAKRFLYQHGLITSDRICRIPRFFGHLFNPYVLFPSLCISVIAIFLFFQCTGNVMSFTSRMGAGELVLLLVLIICSSLFHEIGHASAARYFGAESGEIGIGLYLNFPVLYTNVSDIWKLPLKQRCIVNLAGVYFQSILLVFLIISYAFSGSEIIKYLILTITLGFVLTLNPFFKFDGYWLATDLLGVPNLRQRTKEIFKYYVVRIFHRGQDCGRPYILSVTNKKMRRVIIIYAIAVNIFMGYYFCYVIPVFFKNFFINFPSEFLDFIVCVSNNIVPPFALIRNLATQMLFFGLIAYMLYRLISPYIRKLLKHHV